MDFIPKDPRVPSTQHFKASETFKNPLDPENEQMTFNFLNDSLEDQLSKLKPREFYADQLKSFEGNIDSLDKFHMLNISRL